LYETVPKFEKFFRNLLQNAFIASQRRIIDMISLTADDRYCNFITNIRILKNGFPKNK
jgi:hypothetical protein